MGMYFEVNKVHAFFCFKRQIIWNNVFCGRDVGYRIYELGLSLIGRPIICSYNRR